MGLTAADPCFRNDEAVARSGYTLFPQHCIIGTIPIVISVARLNTADGMAVSALRQCIRNAK